jgi:hypothetical protein
LDSGADSPASGKPSSGEAEPLQKPGSKGEVSGSGAESSASGKPSSGEAEPLQKPDSKEHYNKTRYNIEQQVNGKTTEGRQNNTAGQEKNDKPADKNPYMSGAPKTK